LFTIIGQQNKVFYGSIGNLRASFGNSLVNGFIDLAESGGGTKI